MRAVSALTVVAMLALVACGAMADKRYDYPAWGFSVVFPTPPKVEETQATADTVRSFEAKVDHGDGAIRAVLVLEMGDTSLDDIGKDLSARLGSAIQGDAAAPTVVRTPDGVEGREIRFSHDGKPVFISRYFLVGTRRYEVNAGAVDGFDEPFVQGYLNSFRFIGPAPASGNSSVH